MVLMFDQNISVSKGRDNTGDNFRLALSLVAICGRVQKFIFKKVRLSLYHEVPVVLTPDPTHSGGFTVPGPEEGQLSL